MRKLNHEQMWLRRSFFGYIWDAVDGMGEYGLASFYEKGSRGGKVIRPKLLHRRAAIQSVRRVHSI